MKFKDFMTIMYDELGKGLKSKNVFTIDFFNWAALENEYILDEEYDEDKVKNWYRTDGRRSYMKVFIGKTFNATRFNTELKARTLTSWKMLQNAFLESATSKTGCIIDCKTENHDIFLQSIEWQFKTILGIPIIINCQTENGTYSDDKSDEMLDYNSSKLNEYGELNPVDIPSHLKDLILQIIKALLVKINVPHDELENIINRIEKNGFSELLDDTDYD